jgi:hypothetical protein
LKSSMDFMKELQRVLVLRLEHAIQYNEAEQCRRSDDPFEIPVMILRDPNIGEAGAPPQTSTDQIAIPLFKKLTQLANFLQM